MIEHGAESLSVFLEPTVSFQRSAGESVQQFTTKTANAAERESEQAAHVRL